MSALQLTDISKRYGGVQALEKVSVHFEAGQVHCLAGVNGSGKSTLIKIVSGVETPDSGSIVLNGVRIERNSPRSAMQAGIHVIYQDIALFGNLSVAENICMLEHSLARSPLVSRRHDLEKAAEVCERLEIELDLRARLEDLPLADRQLAAICRALNQEARVLFMDEPTTALTWREAERLFTVVRRLVESGVAVVFVSHKLDEVLAISDTITVLRNGVVVADGAASDFDQVSLAEALVGQSTSTDRLVVDPSGHAGPVPLVVEGLGAKGTFADITFQVGAGEIVGMTGLRGSGRSQIAEAIFGLHGYDEGRVVVGGQPVKPGDPIASTRAGIGYVPEDRLGQGVFMDQSIASNITSASLEDLSNRAGVVRRRQAAEMVERGLVDLNVKYGNSKDRISTLSGGNQQKVLLAKWIETAPKVLILNGPTVGVDIGSIVLGQQFAQMGHVIVPENPFFPTTAPHTLDRSGRGCRLGQGPPNPAVTGPPGARPFRERP